MKSWMSDSVAGLWEIKAMAVPQKGSTKVVGECICGAARWRFSQEMGLGICDLLQASEDMLCAGRKGRSSGVIRRVRWDISLEPIALIRLWKNTPRLLPEQFS